MNNHLIEFMDKTGAAMKAKAKIGNFAGQWFIVPPGSRTGLFMSDRQAAIAYAGMRGWDWTAI